jgi:hypothetical protein
MTRTAVGEEKQKRERVFPSKAFLRVFCVLERWVEAVEWKGSGMKRRDGSRLAVLAGVCLSWGCWLQAADSLATGDQALRDGNLSAAHAAYGEALAANPADLDANLMRAATLLGDLFENPTANLSSVLDSFKVSYVHDLYGDQEGASALDAESYTDSNGNGEYDYGEYFEDWQNPNGVWDEGEWYWDENNNGQYDGPEEFTDTNNNGQWDDDLIPEDAVSVNTLLDALHGDLGGRLDEALALMEKIESADAGWTRTLSSDMLPGRDERDRASSTTVNKADILIAEAGLNLVRFVLGFADGYDLDVNYDEVTDDGFDLTQAYWDSQTNFFISRKADAFASAKASLQAALTKLVAGSELIVSHGIPARSEGVASEYGNEYCGWNVVKDGAEQLLATLDGSAEVSIEDKDPILVNLAKLFDAPVDRTVLAKYDVDAGEMAWDAVADPTLNGVFPGKTMAEWYKYHSMNAYDEMNAVAILSDTGVPTVIWNGKKMYGQYWDSNNSSWNWGEHWGQQNEYLFEDKMRFEIYRGTSFVATRYPGEYPVGSAWSLENATAPASNLYYKVKVVFSDGANQTETMSRRAYLDSDGDGMPDYWEEQYGLDKNSSNDEWNDSDGDWVYNLREFQAGSDPTVVDTDQDGMSDDYEVEYDLKPTDPSDATADLDGDGYTNLAEYKSGTDADDFSDNPATVASWECISVADDGQWADEDALIVMSDTAMRVRPEGLSSDGRRLFFVSFASNLDPRADGMRENLYVRDRRTGTTEAINVGHDGTTETFSNASDRDKFAIATLDGRFMVFTSDSNNLVPGIEKEAGMNSRLYLRDLENRETILICQEPVDGWMLSQTAGKVLISSDGRFVTFEKSDPVNAMQQVYRFDRESRTTEQVSVSESGVGAQSEASLTDSMATSTSLYPSSRMSQAGRFVFFSSYDESLVVNDTNMQRDLFVRDMDEKTTNRVNVGVDGGQSTRMDDCFVRASDDGRYAVFTSGDSTLAGDAWQNDDMGMFNGLFVRDVVEQKTTFIANIYDSMAMGSTVLVTPDARYVAYTKSVDTDNAMYVGVIYVYDRVNGTTVLATPSLSGRLPAASCSFAAVSDAASVDVNALKTCLSDNGRYLFFRSTGDDLVAGDTTGSSMTTDPADIFVRDLLHGTTQLVNVNSEGEQSFANSAVLPSGDQFDQASADGRIIYFASTSHLAGTEPDFWDWDYQERLKLYRRDLTRQRTSLVMDYYHYSEMGDSSRDIISPSGDFGIFRMYEYANGTEKNRLYLVGNVDTDGDGISDNDERWFGMDPHNAADGALDPDGDGLDNAAECRAGSDPFDMDTDDDGLPDDWEVAEGGDPLLADAQRDPDGDGQSNQDEFLAGLHPTVFENVDFLVLHQGWNMVSIPSGLKTPTVDSVFQDKIYKPVWAWNAFDQIYSDAGANGGVLSDKAGYWVFAPDEAIVVFEKD